MLFFISVSAVCVTGLSVFEIGSVLTPFGQIILLMLIQVGGLGIMTFYALVSLSLNHRFLSTESQQLQAGWDTQNLNETLGLIKAIFFVTFLVEIIGAIIIYFHLDVTLPIKERLFFSIFHSVSAFCNAGFSLFSNSLEVFSSHTFLMVTFCCLIIIGGIGFPVIFEIYHRYVSKEKHRLKLQTRLVLWISFILTFFGMVILFVDQLMLGTDISMLQAFFHSVSARTAGFSMFDLNNLHLSSLWIILLLMFIGASPGSTGGGIKTTTFGLLVVTLVATIRSKEYKCV